MEVRRIFKNGNSIVVSLPKQFLQELKLDQGDYVSLEHDPIQGTIICKPFQKDQQRAPSVISEFIENYGKVLEELDDDSE